MTRLLIDANRHSTELLQSRTAPLAGIFVGDISIAALPELTTS